MKTLFFKNAQEFREWLEKNYDKESELGVGFYKKDSGKSGISYKEAVQQALCFGWIDGVGRRIDEKSHMNRFTPRKKKSTWSLVNVAKVKELKKAGLMTAAGLLAFEARDPARTGIYSSEQKEVKLDPASEKLFRANKKAWAFFESKPLSYRRPAIWLVISAKKPETREKRLRELIRDSAAGRTIKALTRTEPKKKIDVSAKSE